MALTISLGNIIVYAVNLADNIMIGGYSELSLSAVAVVNQIQQSGDPGMKEGRIAHDPDDRAFFRRFGDAVCHGEPCPHAKTGVGTRQRRKHPQRITADVTGDDHIELGQGVKETAVRASGTEDRWPGRQIPHHFHRFRLR